MQSSPTIGSAFDGLTQRQNQAVLDGIVTAIFANGDLVIALQGTQLICRALIDHPFSVGERVVLGRADDGSYIVMGAGTSGVEPSPSVGLPALPPSLQAFASATLHDAVVRLIDKQNRILRNGIIVTVLADGSLWVELGHGGPQPTVAHTTQLFSAGQSVYAIKADEGQGQWRVLGATEEG